MKRRDFWHLLDAGQDHQQDATGGPLWPYVVLTVVIGVVTWWVIA